MNTVLFPEYSKKYSPENKDFAFWRFKFNTFLKNDVQSALSFALLMKYCVFCHYLCILSQSSDVLDQWKNISKALTSAGHSLVAVQDNLIDAVWIDRPERPSTQLRTMGLEYTGLCHTGLTPLLYTWLFHSS